MTNSSSSPTKRPLTTASSSADNNAKQPGVVNQAGRHDAPELQGGSTSVTMSWMRLIWTRIRELSDNRICTYMPIKCAEVRQVRAAVAAKEQRLTEQVDAVQKDLQMLRSRCVCSDHNDFCCELKRDPDARNRLKLDLADTAKEEAEKAVAVELC
jgi:hypothetical protein